MTRRILFEAVVLILVFASIWGIFTLFPIFPDKTAFGVSLLTEEKIGKLMLNTILSNREYGQVSIEALDSSVSVIKERLVQAIERSNYDYRIVILKNSEINAFTLPGGNILVTTALVKISDSPEELAGVLAHEMAHVEKRHVISRLMKKFTLSMLLSDNAILSEASRSLLSTAFDRRQEEEADRLSMDLLEKAEINPQILGTFFQRLKEEEGTYDSRFTIMMTHPHIDARIKTALEYTTAENFREKKFKIDWQRIKRLLDETHS